MLDKRRTELLSFKNNLDGLYKKLSQQPAASEEYIFQRPIDALLEMPDDLRDFRESLPVNGSINR